MNEIDKNISRDGNERLKISVVIASLGRPQNIAALLASLAAQSQLPAQVILSMETTADAPPDADYPFMVEKIFGPRGLSVQRNRGLDRLNPDIDIVVFYDDDFVPSRFALAGMAQFFQDHAHVAGAHGLVMQDGIGGPGITAEDALAIVEAADTKGAPLKGHILSLTHGLYGCNMAYRVAQIRDIRFDEGLPLYAWFEDLDFGARVPGDLVHTDAFRGVHCGEKRGRERNGKRLGYSQVANPVYMMRKGTLSRQIVRRSILRHCAINHVRMLRPEPWIDRRGRAAGNRLALFDLLRGRINPKRILEF
jgi:glycosyltransferase involved in cell wall biosynthesis